MASRLYSTFYERLVANTELAEPGNPMSCWIWTGTLSGTGYPRLAVRVPGEPTPRKVAAHRAMLEEVLGVVFPLDEAGHLCANPLCVSPLHLEVQTRAHNMAEQRCCGKNETGNSWIPVLFPREDTLMAAIEKLWGARGAPATACPF